MAENTADSGHACKDYQVGSWVLPLQYTLNKQFLEQSREHQGIGDIRNLQLVKAE